MNIENPSTRQRQDCNSLRKDCTLNIQSVGLGQFLSAWEKKLLMFSFTLNCTTVELKTEKCELK